MIICFSRSPHLDLGGLGAWAPPCVALGLHVSPLPRAPGPLPLLLSPPSRCGALDSLAGCDSVSSAPVRSSRLPLSEDDVSRRVCVRRRHRLPPCRVGFHLPPWSHVRLLAGFLLIQVHQHNVALLSLGLLRWLLSTSAAWLVAFFASCYARATFPAHVLDW